MESDVISVLMGGSENVQAMVESNPTFQIHEYALVSVYMYTGSSIAYYVVIISGHYVNLLCSRIGRYGECIWIKRWNLCTHFWTLKCNVA